MKRQWILQGGGICAVGVLLLLGHWMPLANVSAVFVFFAFSAGLTVLYHRGIPVLFHATALIMLCFAFGLWPGLLCAAAVQAYANFVGGDILKKKTVKSVALKSSAVYAIFGILLLLYFNYQCKVNWIDVWFDGAMQVIEDFKQVYAEAAVALGEDAAIYESSLQMLGTVVEQIKRLFPAIGVTVACIAGYASLWIIALVCRIGKADTAFVPHFSTFRCSLASVVCGVLSLILYVALQKHTVYGTVFLNIYTIISFVMKVCALSLVDYFLKSKRWIFILRLLLLCGIWLVSSQILSLLLMGLAFLDAKMNMRGLQD